MSQELMLHRGGQLVQKAELDLIELPQETASYMPVSHYHLAEKLLTISRDILSDYLLIGEQYAIARQGNQLFALLKFESNQSKEMCLSVAFRNSYDRSMSIGLAIGASVFICDNLALNGEIAVLKKHTKGVWATLEDLAITTLYKSQYRFQKVLADAERLKALPLGDEQAAELAGRLYFAETISPRQLTVLKEQWLRPVHTDFLPRNRWSFLNAMTEALKSTPPHSVMEKHIEGYNTVIDVREDSHDERKSGKRTDVS